MIAPARLAAYEILRVVSTGRDLGSALKLRARLQDERDRALAGEIATGTLRWQGAFDHVVETFTKRSSRRFDPEVLDILRMTMFQLLYLDRIPASAAVKDAVDLVGKVGKRSAAGLVNAVLRRVSRERDHLPLPPLPANPTDRAAALAYLSVTCSHPEWLVNRWLDRYGFDAVEAWTRFNNAPAKLTLRVNTIKATTADVMNRLSARGIETVPARHAADALIVQTGNPVLDEMNADGLYFVQDEASQLVGAYAGARPGERVLDACASPGGKTTQMAAAMEGRGLIAASDVRSRRVRLLAQTIRRSGSRLVRIVQADISRPLPFAAIFDRVLLDAPCSGLGTIRRDPDIKWRRLEADLARLAAGQLEMLKNAAAVVRPGGVVVYATCSSEPEENEGVVEAFLAERSDFRPAGSYLMTLPFRDQLEAFFAAILVSDKDLR